MALKKVQLLGYESVCVCASVPVSVSSADAKEMHIKAEDVLFP